MKIKGKIKKSMKKYELLSGKKLSPIEKAVYSFGFCDGMIASSEHFQKELFK